MSKKFLSIKSNSLYLPLEIYIPDEAIPPSTAWFIDDFEGPMPKGWRSEWVEEVYDVDTYHYTTTNGGAPTGGGTHAYCQNWNDYHPCWLLLPFSAVSGMPATIGSGEAFYLSYWTKFHATFDFDSTDGFKQIIIPNNFNSETNRFYIDFLWSDELGVLAQGSSYYNWRFGNAGGGTYHAELDKWVHFEWYLMNHVSAGTVLGWVDGVQRFNYTGIPTSGGGAWDQLWIAWTFNNQVSGANQLRYMDLVTLGPGSMAPAI